MKKKIDDPGYIGGQGPLTKEEEIALSKYFAEKKAKLENAKIKKEERTSKKKQSEPV